MARQHGKKYSLINLKKHITIADRILLLIIMHIYFFTNSSENQKFSLKI
ncbi:MAG TPA: hypothetical protein H9804_03695 [Candidatus Mucispirillum faecigallinarum]|uniref:Uncharacterized protein n=1 Tax=Candidatus Mucispirillum faecigallinarum TaxID=2838699 RepID=A0A9D2GU20_9BACT|nr:hypothetical protein [Candidatus Mucispirillum faecigallinarum]